MATTIVLLLLAACFVIGLSTQAEPVRVPVRVSRRPRQY